MEDEAREDEAPPLAPPLSRIASIVARGAPWENAHSELVQNSDSAVLSADARGLAHIGHGPSPASTAVSWLAAARRPASVSLRLWSRELAALSARRESTTSRMWLVTAARGLRPLAMAALDPPRVALLLPAPPRAALLLPAPARAALFLLRVIS